MPVDQPNILYLMADDHAANAIGAYGSRLHRVSPTNNIDRIADEGIRADNGVCTNAICTPSRASIMTGQYGHRNGVRTLDDALDPDRDNLAKRMQDAGYQTAAIGKWHLKTEPSGFDYYNVLPGQGDYHDPKLKEKGDEWRDGGRGGQEHSGFVTDVITDESLDWLERRDLDQPFFLMTHFKAPHDPWDYPERFEDLFEDETIPEPTSLFESLDHRSEGSREYGFRVSEGNPRGSLIEWFTRDDWPTGTLDVDGMTDEEVTRAAYQKYLGDYLRCIAAIDENVGRLLDYLDEAGLAEDTLVVYTSDQGMFLGEHDLWDKRWMYEESLQMPFLARYPGEIPEDTVADQLLSNVDFAPTLLDYAGVDVPEAMQGESFRKILASEEPDDWRDDVYYHYWMHRAHLDVPAHYGLRTDRYKLIFFYGRPLDASGARDTPTEPGWELYDLQRDPNELENVYDDSRYADVREDLKERLLDRKEEFGDEDDAYPELMEIRSEYW
ncbi:sulfatase family protein [Halosimplex amylolyticum]|uniref:sulfatase family protein n=1 Tax=Halosimplex amylolyticum TaxID=3396616 RepID=UPI003F5781F1